MMYWNYCYQFVIILLYYRSQTYKNTNFEYKDRVDIISYCRKCFINYSIHKCGFKITNIFATSINKVTNDFHIS